MSAQHNGYNDTSVEGVDRIVDMYLQATANDWHASVFPPQYHQQQQDVLRQHALQQQQQQTLQHQHALQQHQQLNRYVSPLNFDIGSLVPCAVQPNDTKIHDRSATTTTTASSNSTLADDLGNCEFLDPSMLTALDSSDWLAADLSTPLKARSNTAPSSSNHNIVSSSFSNTPSEPTLSLVSCTPDQSPEISPFLATPSSEKRRSTSFDPELLLKTDPKKWSEEERAFMKRVRNTNSARRSRQRKAIKINDLNDRIACLERLTTELGAANTRLLQENNAYVDRITYLEMELAQARDAISAWSQSV